jgi:hypothetical protein
MNLFKYKTTNQPMEPLTILTIMAGVSWVSNLYDYIAFSSKHRETQEQVKYLKGEISSLNRTLGYMTNEIRENNKIIKELKNIMDNAICE